MKINRSNLQRWVGLIVSLFGNVLAFWGMSFNVIAIPLKETFNYTQSQVELVSSVGAVGFTLSFLETVISSKFGYLVSYFIGWIISPAGLGAMYTAAIYRSFFQNWPAFLGLFELVIGIGTSFLFMRFVNIGVNNFPKKHTGKIIGLYTALGATSKFFYAGMFEIFFYKNFTGYLLTISFVWVVVFGICFFLHRPVPLNEIDEPILREEKSSDTQYGSNRDSRRDYSEDTSSTKEILKSPQFHVIVWSAALLYSTAFSSLNNLTAVGQSAGMHDPIHLVYVVSGVIVFCRLTVGFVYDKLPSNTARYGMLLVYCIVLMVALVLVMVWFSQTGIILITVFVGVAIGCGYTLPLAVIVTKFGRKHYSLVAGLFHLLISIFIICNQTFIGLIYDTEAKEEMSKTSCTGSVCFFWSFLLLSSLCCLGTVMLLLLFCLDRKREATEDS